MKDRYFGAHEFQDREETIAISSDRTFGLVSGAIFALLGSISFYHGGTRWHYWFPVALVFVMLALAAPHALAPLNRLWSKLGLLLHGVMSPLVLALMFYGCLTPIGFLMRASGNDPLRRGFESSAKSYWIMREPPGPSAETFKNQF